MKVILFDIDRTLMASPSVNMTRFEDPILMVHGKVVFVNSKETDGLTDRLILKLSCDKLGITDYRFPEMFEAMLASFYRTLKTRRYYALPGVNQLLETLKSHNIKVGNVTGNIRKIAIEKMRAVGLEGYFTFGGYGCSEHSSRHELVSVALNELNDTGVSLNDVVLVGDTLRDIVCGREAGVKTIGVGTGSFTKLELQNAGANLAANDLGEGFDEIMEFILS